jgi:hypothetical protein
MAGYNNFSKSNNAVAAEASGRYPASVLAGRLGVTTGAIRAVLRTSEYHHSSKFFNSVDYYDESEALEVLDELRAWRDTPKTETVYENCSGSYLVWGGTRSHPRATEISFCSIKVTKKGKWFTLHLSAGRVRKGEDTRGFHLSSGGRKLTFNP